MNEIIPALKISMRRERLFMPLQTKMEISVKDLLVNVKNTHFNV